MSHKNDKQYDLDKLEQEYTPVEDDIMLDEDERVHRLKQIITNNLSESDRRIILLYTELQSQRLVAQELGVSSATANIVINRIRKEIKQMLYDND